MCARFGAAFVEAPSALKLGVSRNFASTDFPLNDLRHLPVNETCGWFIWSGTTLSQEPDFFVPMHVVHLADICPNIQPYLGLSPGWRFQLAPGHEDAWWDEALLDV